MTDDEHGADAAAVPPPDGWAAVMVSPDRRAAAHGALVLASRGLDWDLEPLADGRWRVLVPAPQYDGARVEIDAYLRENRRRPSPLPRIAPGAPIGALVYGIVLCGIAVAVEAGALGDGAELRGRLDAEAVRAGEWWRAVTALTLHTGPTHLGANLLFGGLFGVLLAEICGVGLAWLAILSSGAIGNLANVYLRDGQHLSIGASTAVFGALGVIGGFEGLRRGGLMWPARRRWAPLIGALALLAMFGGGGDRPLDRTDVAAHLLGFLSGLALAWPVAAAARRLPPANRAAQALTGALALAAVVAAWAAALPA